MLKPLKFYFIFILFSSCTSLLPPENCLHINMPTYDFNLPVTISPTIDTFNIGDTITITSEFSEEMQEINLGESVELIDWSFYPITSLYKIDGEETIDTALNFFEVLIDSTYSYSFYEFNSGRLVFKGQYDYNNSIYKLEYKLVTTESGLYFHTLGSSLYSFGQNLEFEKKCSNTPVDAFIIMDDRENSNVEFLLDSPDEEMHIWHERRDKRGATFNSVGGYCFYVR